MAPAQKHNLGVMSFGDHLEELRARILRSLLIAAVGVCVALIFQEELMRLLTVPHNRAMSGLVARAEARAVARELARIRKSLAAVPPGEGAALVEAEQDQEWLRRARQVLAGIAPGAERDFHELVLERVVRRTRLLRRSLYPQLVTLSEEFAVSCREGESRAPRQARTEVRSVLGELQGIQEALATWKKASPQTQGSLPWRPLEDAYDTLKSSRRRLQQVMAGDFSRQPLHALGYPDTFFAYLKVCFLAGLILAMPWFTLEMWGFVSKGLYPRERRSVYPFIPFSMISLVLGACFAYFVLVPVGLGYLSGYGSSEIVKGTYTIREYLSLIFTLILGMGLVFQLPLVMIFLTRARIVETQDFRRYRKICILGALTLAAFLTPPDVITQMLMAGPLILLYESGIWISDFFTRRKNKRDGTPSALPSESEVHQT
ncbi:MAG: twin-arginine translocase subunit TatC [Planctomycetota bacterium]